MASLGWLGPGTVLTNTSSRWKRADGTTTFGTAHLADLNDDLDSTRAVLSGNGAATLKVDNDFLAPLDAAVRIARVRLYARILTPTGYTSTLRLFQGATLRTSVTHAGTGSYFNRYSAWVNTDASGSEWTDATINQLEWDVQSSVGFTSLTEFRVQMDMRRQATVTASSPDNAEFASPGQSFSWVFEGDGESQYRYNLKIFTQAVAEGGGFDPATSTAVYNETTYSNVSSRELTLDDGTSGIGFSPPLNLTRGATYYWAVRASKTFNGSEWWSEWSPLAKFVFQPRPTATSVTPSGSVTTASRPAIGWTYTAAAGGVAQGAYAVKIFKQPVGGWSGFDPGQIDSEVGQTAKPVAGSGSTSNNWITEGNATSFTPSVPLDNSTTYRAYVKVRRGNPYIHGMLSEWSDWAYSEFTINITPPTAPSLTLTPDAANGRMTLQTNVTGAGTYSDYRMRFERSLDGGTTWDVVTPWYFHFFGVIKATDSSRVLTFTTPGLTTWYDYTVPFNVAVSYRVRVIQIVTGQDFASNWVVATATVVTPKVWLKVLDSPTESMSFPVMDDWLQINRSLPRTIHRPLGRSRPVVMRGQPTGDSFSVKFLLLGRTAYTAFMAKIQSGQKFYLQNESKTWYVEVAGDVAWEDRLWDSKHGDEESVTVVVPFIEVSP